jgi:hypothetical protein
MASIYILFPKEQPELVQNAMQHFQWAVERFEAMSERNALARAALGVLQAIRIRLRKSLGLGLGNTTQPQQQQSITSTPAEGGSAGGFLPRSPLPPILPPPTGHTPANSSDNASSPRRGSETGPLSAGPGGSSTSASVAAASSNALTPATSASAEYYAGADGGGGFDWSLPDNFDWSSIQPIFATGDLLYNDLVGIPDGDGHSVPAWGSGNIGGGGGVGAQPWQFEGDFGNDSVWNLLNQYAPM